MKRLTVRTLFTAAVILISSSHAAHAGPIRFEEVLSGLPVAGGLRFFQDKTALPKVTIIDVGDVTGTVCDCTPDDGAGLLVDRSILNRKPGRIALFAAIGAPGGWWLWETRLRPKERTDDGGSRRVSEVPEPATLLLLASGLGALGGVLRRRRKA